MAQAAIMTRATQPSLLWPGLNMLFGFMYKKGPKDYTAFTEMKTSTKAHEEFSEQIGFGLAAKVGELEASKMDAMSEGIKIYAQHEAYGLAFAISHENKKDQLYSEVAAARIPSLTRAMLLTKEFLGHEVLNNAFNPAFGLRPDGATLIANNHSTIGGGTSNTLAVAADLTELSLEEALIDVSRFEDGRGNKINARVKRLIIPSESQFNAQRLLTSNLQPNGSSNNINVIKAMGLIPEVRHSTYLEDPDAFFLQTDVPGGPCEIVREPVSLWRWQDKGTRAEMIQAYFRSSFTVIDWRSIFGSPGV